MNERDMWKMFFIALTSLLVTTMVSYIFYYLHQGVIK